MRHPALLAIAIAASALFTVGCSKPQPAIQELGPAEAAASFEARFASGLGMTDLAAHASSALVKKSPDGAGTQIVYVFRGLGGPLTVGPLIEKLDESFPEVPSQDCWMPWERFADPQTANPAPHMGTFRNGNSFQITLWIDSQANDLFVCYAEPAPAMDVPPE